MYRVFQAILEVCNIKILVNVEYIGHTSSYMT